MSSNTLFHRPRFYPLKALKKRMHKCRGIFAIVFVFSEVTGTTASDTEINAAADCLTPSCDSSLDDLEAFFEDNPTYPTYPTYTYATYTEPTYPTYPTYNYSAYAYPTVNYSAYNYPNYPTYNYSAYYGGYSYNYSSSGNASGPAYYYYYYRV
jgi:hypothetical protein